MGAAEALDVDVAERDFVDRARASELAAHLHRPGAVADPADLGVAWYRRNHTQLYTDFGQLSRVTMGASTNEAQA